MQQEGRSTPAIWVLITVICAVIALAPLALNIFVPSIPKLQYVFAADFSTVQLTLSLYLAGMAVGQLVYGPVSDRLGRRSTLLAGVVLYVLAGAVCLWAPTVETLIVGRFAQAFGGCAGMVVGRAMIRDLFDRARSAEMLSLATMAMMVVPMVAPSLGGVLDHWFGWQSVFAFVVLAGGLVGLAAYRWLPETRAADNGPTAAMSSLGRFSFLLRQRAFNGYMLQVSFTTGVFYCSLAGAPYVVIEIMGQTSDVYGYYFVLMAAGYMLGNFINSRLTRRLSIDHIITFGTALSLCGTLLLLGLQLLSLLTTPGILFLGLVGVGFGNGLSVQNGLAGAISVEPRLAGTASGITGFLQMTVGGLVSYVVGLVMTDSALPMIVIMVGSAALGIAAHLLATLPTRAPSPAE